jgi:hypothetical protein
MWVRKVRGLNTHLLFKRYGHIRASKRQHPVQGSGGDRDFGCLGLVGARSKRIADDPPRLPSTAR